MRVDSNGTCDPERRLQEVLAAYYEAIEGETAPDPRSLIEGHPELAGELAEFFALQEDLHRLVAPIRDAAIAPDDGEPATASPLHGRRGIGDYDLLGEIARGGVGIVYRARQRSLNRPVAVKVLRDGADATPADARRFRNEAELAANLDHPNIVPIFEVGEDQGCGFFSMRLIEGGSLAERVSESGTDPRTAARWIAIVAHAIQYAHERGILHRDLKPSNVLIDDRGEPHVADFGLARRLDGDSDLTRTGMVVGTPSYMAPEQADGRKGIVTTATDVHGLGAVLYFLLTGRPPYGGPTTLEILDRVRAASPKPPSTIRQAADRDLETVCLRCLEPDPARRYASAAAVAEDLERWLEGRSIFARRAGRAERAWRLCRRHPRITGLAALTTLLAIMATAGLFASDRARREAARLDQVARRSERSLRLVQYAHDVLQSSHSWTGNNPEAVLRLLDRHIPKPGEEDLRDFTWHYFHRLATVGEPPLLGHTGEVYYAAFSPDGRTLATASKDKMVRLWDVATRATRSVLQGHKDEVNWVSYSPDGRALATTGNDKTVRIWDAETGRIRSTLAGHGEEVVGVIFTPDGRRVISCSRHGRVISWNLSTAEIDRTFTVKVGTVQSLAISPDGKLLAITGVAAVIWDWVAKREQARLETDERPMYGVAFSHDGAYLATACAGAVHVWETRAWKILETHYDESRMVESVAFSADDRILVSVCHDGVIHLTDRATGVGQRIATGQRPGRLWCVSFSPGGRTCATTCAGGTVKLWDLDRDRSLVSFHVPARDSIASALSPDGARFLAADLDRNLWTYETRSGRLVSRTRFAAQGELVGCGFTDDAGRLVTMDKDGTITVWDLKTQRRIREFHSSAAHNCGCGLSPGAEWIARYIHGHGVYLWDVATREERYLATEWTAHMGVSLSRHGMCAFRPAATTASNPYMWDPHSGRTWSARDPGHNGEVYAQALSPDGTILATAGADGAVILWDAKTLDLQFRFDGAHGAAATEVAFSPDGRTLVTGGADGRVRLWDPDSRRELATLLGHSGPVGRSRFSADGRTLATCCYGVDGRNKVIIWRAAPMDPGTSGP
jgi:WD40 repeat protein